MPEHAAAVVGRGVARAQKCPHWWQLAELQTFGRVANAHQWSAEVSFHVVGKRLHGGHVQHPTTLELGRCVLGQQAVDGMEERRQGLARTGRRMDQSVGTGGDGRPAEPLCVRGPGERGLEPRLRGGGEHDGSVPVGCDKTACRVRPAGYAARAGRVSRTARKASTTLGSNCVPAPVISSNSACWTVRAGSYGRWEVMASKESATEMMRAGRGISEPPRP